MLHLNIQIQELEFEKGLFNKYDTLRVSVTTLPGEQKQKFKFDAKKLDRINPYFSVKINEFTEKIIIVFRKKNYSEKDPIFASTVILRSDICKTIDDNSNREMKKINIFEPKQQLQKSKAPKSGERKIVGCMNVTFSLTEGCICKNSAVKNNTGKKRHSKRYQKMNGIDGDENDQFFNNLI